MITVRVTYRINNAFILGALERAQNLFAVLRLYIIKRLKRDHASILN